MVTPEPRGGAPTEAGAHGDEDFLERYRARSEARNAAVRETLEPLAPGERPWPLRAAVALTTLAGVTNLVLYAAGARIDGSKPAASETIVFAAMMLACAAGMWRRWAQAVLVFMALLAIVVLMFSLFLVEASNLAGVLIPPIFILGGGFLFWKLVRVLGRMQVPPPAR